MLAVWVQLADDTNQHIPASIFEVQAVHLFWDADAGLLWLDRKTDWSPAYQCYSTPLSIPRRQWVHIVATDEMLVPGVSNNVRIYVNGGKVADCIVGTFNSYWGLGTMWLSRQGYTVSGWNNQWSNYNYSYAGFWTHPIATQGNVTLLYQASMPYFQDGTHMVTLYPPPSGGLRTPYWNTISYEVVCPLPILAGGSVHLSVSATVAGSIITPTSGTFSFLSASPGAIVPAQSLVIQAVTGAPVTISFSVTSGDTTHILPPDSLTIIPTLLYTDLTSRAIFLWNGTVPLSPTVAPNLAVENVPCASCSAQYSRITQFYNYIDMSLQGPGTLPTQWTPTTTGWTWASWLRIDGGGISNPQAFGWLLYWGNGDATIKIGAYGIMYGTCTSRPFGPFAYLLDNTWVHLAIVALPIKGMQYFVNGLLAADCPLIPPFVNVNTQPVRMGWSAGYDSTYYWRQSPTPMSVGNFGFWTESLSQAEIQWLVKGVTPELIQGAWSLFPVPQPPLMLPPLANITLNYQLPHTWGGPVTLLVTTSPLGQAEPTSLSWDPHLPCSTTVRTGRAYSIPQHLHALFAAYNGSAGQLLLPGRQRLDELQFAGTVHNLPKSVYSAAPLACAC